MLPKPTEVIYILCPAALRLQARDSLTSSPTPSPQFTFNVSPHFPARALTPSISADRANQSFTTSSTSRPPLFPLFGSPTVFSLPEKTEPDEVYDPITAWKHGRPRSLPLAIPHLLTPTHTHTLQNACSASAAAAPSGSTQVYLSCCISSSQRKEAKCSSANGSRAISGSGVGL